MTNKEAEIYIHIPFCIRKCAYCDFLSFASDEGTRKRYVSALTHEIAAACTELRGKRIRSVFIGGGTPSVLETGQLASKVNTSNVLDTLLKTMQGRKRKRRYVFAL